MFREEGPAWAFFEANRGMVVEFVHETLVSHFDNYFVWQQTRLHPKP